MATEPESTVISTNTNVSRGRRFANFLKRLLQALIKITLVLGIIAGIGFITYLVVQELQRSFRVVSERVDRNQAYTLNLNEEMLEIKNTLSSTKIEQDSRLAALESYVDTTLADDLVQQNEMLRQQETMLTTLTVQLNALLTETVSLDGRLSTMSEGVIALQGDMNDNNTRLDELGGEIDTLSNESETLSTQVTGLQTSIDSLPLDDLEQMRQVVNLFRIWEMITRARLRLLENNAGLAAADTAQALAYINALVIDENVNPDILSTLVLVQARLVLADTNLPDNSTLAVSDLESAWAELDTALAALLGIEPVTLNPNNLPDQDAEVTEETNTGEAPNPTPTPAPDS